MNIQQLATQMSFAEYDFERHRKLGNIVEQAKACARWRELKRQLREDAKCTN